MGKRDQPPEIPNLGTLLNTASFQLAGNLRTAQQPFNCMVVKYQPGHRYLLVTTEQWLVLREFRESQKVAQVLLQLLAEQRCPPLREFYDLVATALELGILQTEGVPAPPADTPCNWRVSFRGSWARNFSYACLLVAVGLLAWRPPALPASLPAIVLGWVAACLIVSLGQVLAACVVRGGGGDVYRPRGEWRSLFPGFRADLSDAVMGGPATMMAAALTQLALALLAAGVAACWWPPAALVLTAAGWLQFSPLWPSAGREYLRARFGDPRSQIISDSYHSRWGRLSLLSRTRRQLINRIFLLAGAVASVLWLAVVALGAAFLLQLHVPGLVQRFEAAGGWRYTGLALACLAAGAIISVAAILTWRIYRRGAMWWQRRQELQQRAGRILQSTESTIAWLGQTPLFHELGPAELQAVATAMKREDYGSRHYVVREGEPGDRLYVVVAGRLEVRRNYTPKRSEHAGELCEDDIFGEIALLESGVRTRSVRTLGKCTLLSLDRAAFEQLLLSRFSRETIATAVQKLGFLHRLEFARQWSPASLAAFARRAKFQEFNEDEVVIREGAANHWLFLVHRGEFSVRQKDREVRRLRPGASFGETSLLRDGIATATVMAAGRGASCLMIAQMDFLGFIAQDFAYGLAFERSHRRP